MSAVEDVVLVYQTQLTLLLLPLTSITVLEELGHSRQRGMDRVGLLPAYRSTAFPPDYNRSYFMCLERLIVVFLCVIVRIHGSMDVH